MKNILINIVVVLVAIMLALALGEAVLRMAGVFYPGFFYVTDPDLGERHWPGQVGRFGQEGNAIISINGAGFRDEDHPHQKPPTTFRIAVIGDSFSEAFQVNLEETFWKQIEDRLRSCQTIVQNVEVLNFGVRGYGTGRQLIALQEYVWEYNPDMVLLAFFTGNDVRNNSRVLEGQYTRTPLPFYDVISGQLHLDKSYRLENIAKLQSFSQRYIRPLAAQIRVAHLFFILRSIYRPVTVPQLVDSRAIRLQSVGLYEPGVEFEVFLPPANVEWSQAWDITERLIVEMAKRTRAYGAQFLLVSLSNGIQVTPEVKSKEIFKEILGVDHLFYPEQRLQSFARQYRIDLIALAEELASYSLTTGNYLHGFPGQNQGFGHWNEVGHREAARLISEDLCERSVYFFDQVLDRQNQSNEK